MVGKLEIRDWRRPAVFGYSVIFLTFGVIGTWAALARLDSAVTAPGVVTVESSRKTVAHLEGGIIRQILAREGQHVQEGDTLFRLDDTAPQASADMSRNQLSAMLATEARLVAERNRSETIEFPSDLVSEASNPVAQHAMADQRKQFEERRKSISGQVSLLEAKVKQYQTELEGLAAEKAGAESQLAFITLELEDLRGLAEKKLIPKSRVLVLEREKARLEGLIGRSTAEASKAHNGIGEAKLQTEQLLQKFAEEVNTSLLDTRQKISDLRERSRVSADVLRRVEVRAPRTGVVQNVRPTTIGGIVKPGEPLLEIIPDGDALMVNAQVSPSDVDAVRSSNEAEVRFNAFHGEVLPIVTGHVTSLSRDRLVDEVTRQPYFLARVVVDQSQLAHEVRDRITAGMAVEVIIPTGERTVVDYLVRPLTNRARKALREQ